MTAKRRKVWANLYEDGEHYAYSRKAECKDAMAEAAHAREVPFVESRPGDVVLSREDVETRATEIAADLVAEGFDTEDMPTFIKCVVRALLRGAERDAKAGRR